MTIQEKRVAIADYCTRWNHDACMNKDGEICPLYHLPETNCYSECTDVEIERHYKILFGDTEPTENAVENAVDMVNKAPHYNKGGVECIKAIEASMSPEEYAGFLKGQVIKYVWRYRHKGKPVEDLDKARYYLDDLIRVTKEAANNA